MRAVRRESGGLTPMAAGDTSMTRSKEQISVQRLTNWFSTQSAMGLPTGAATESA